MTETIVRLAKPMCECLLEAEMFLTLISPQSVQNRRTGPRCCCSSGDKAKGGMKVIYYVNISMIIRHPASKYTTRSEN